MTAMKQALEDAGILMPDQRLRNILAAVPEPRTPEAAQAALVASKDVEAALALFDPQVVAEHLRGKMKEIGAGHVGHASQSATDRPEATRASHAVGASQGADDRPAGDGPSHRIDERQDRFDRPDSISPRKQPAPPTRISKAAARAVGIEQTKTVLDTFAIIDRNGERLPIGEIYVSSYDRLIKMTARRSWASSREHALLTLLKAESERRAVHIPSDAKTRDIFDAPTVERLVATADTLALPRLESANVAA